MTDTPEGAMGIAPHYEIYVTDNYHHDDPDEAYTIRGFLTEEDALDKCRAIINADLEGCAKQHDTAAGIVGCYQMFGENPIIVARNGAPDVKFSGWDYAKAKASEYARQAEQDDTDGHGR